MSSRIEPERLQVYGELEEMRPLTEDRFDKLCRDEDFTRDDLTPEEREYLENSVIPIARDIEKNGQFHAIQVARVNVQMTVVSGYTRYLACKWNGCKVEIETRKFDDDADIYSHIFTENENRADVDPYNRARLIAQSVGLWDEANEEFIPPTEANHQTMTLTEFADNTGWTVERVSEMLNPLRQNKNVREDFGDDLSEETMDIIRRVSDTEEEEYTIAESVYQSDVSSTDEFRDLVSKVQDRYAETDFVHQLCRRLDGTDEEPPTPSLHNSQSAAPTDPDNRYSPQNTLNTNRERGSSIPRKPSEVDDVPTPDSGTSQTDASPDSGTSSTTTTQPTNPSSTTDSGTTGGSMGGSGTGGMSVMETDEDEQTEYDVEDVELDFFDHEDVYQCLAEDADKRDGSVGDMVYKILTEHYTRTERL